MGQLYKEGALSAFPEGESIPISPTSSSSEVNESFGIFIGISAFSTSHSQDKGSCPALALDDTVTPSLLLGGLHPAICLFQGYL